MYTSYCTCSEPIEIKSQIKVDASCLADYMFTLPFFNPLFGLLFVSNLFLIVSMHVMSFTVSFTFPRLLSTPILFSNLWHLRNPHSQVKFDIGCCLCEIMCNWTRAPIRKLLALFTSFTQCSQNKSNQNGSENLMGESQKQ